MTMPLYQKPKLETKMLRRETLIVSVLTPAAIGERTYVVGPIPFPFVLEQISVRPAPTAGNQYRYYFLLSNNDSVGTVGPPNDDNLISMYGQNSYLSEFGFWHDWFLTINREVPQKNMYLKVHISDLAGIGDVHFFMFIIRELKEPSP